MSWFGAGEMSCVVGRMNLEQLRGILSTFFGPNSRRSVMVALVTRLSGISLAKQGKD